MWWVDTKTYVELTRPWFAKVLPFPLSMYILVKTRNHFISRIEATKGGDMVTESEIETMVSDVSVHFLL